MTEPISSLAGQAAAEALKDAQNVQAQAPKEPQGAQFDTVVEAQRVDDATVVRMNTITSQHVLHAARPAAQVPPIQTSLNTQPRAAQGISQLMSDVMHGQNKLEDIIQMSLSGRSFSSQELLAMQAGVYRFTQELELTSKVVEKATASVKQTMNTQV